jgi:hypothetical protein
LVGRLETRDDLNLIAEIAPGSHGREHDLPVFDNSDT